ncbi:3-hydroxyacyl-CoA dehydrogenase NAD-binding domain-containing protein [Dyadobacter sp. 676]|uniref:3-hydroxyacyl-CoA dehydrogenase NAD-binding domain-containing protein n=1 Tax=Dyadobacter sp. 676 TaxID=3088362 RepID=A0AAU8FKZ1_9BACT
MNEPSKLAPVGVVGLGLMGSSIVAALLAAGHPVKAIAPIAPEAGEAPERIAAQLRQCVGAGLIGSVQPCLDALTVSEDYSVLSDCVLVIECVIEKPEIKSAVYQKITGSVGRDCVIGSNTSAIPISELPEVCGAPRTVPRYSLGRAGIHDPLSGNYLRRTNRSPVRGAGF